MAAPDTTNPVLSSLSLAAVNVAGGAQTFTFSAAALDSGSGVEKVVIFFDHSWQDQSGSDSVITLSDTADSFADGTSSSSITFDPATPAGTYAITSVIVYDKAGNWAQYSPDQLAAMGLATSFNVTSDAASDTTPPALTSLSLPIADVTGGSETLSFSAGALDSGSGVDRVTLYFDHSWEGSAGPQNVVVLTDAQDGFGDGSSATSIFFDPTTGAGTYTLTSAVVTDKAGNATEYSPAQLAALGIATSFQVASNTPADTTAPELTLLALPTVDVTSGGETVSFTAGAFDSGSGVDHIDLAFDHSWQDQSGLASVVKLTGEPSTSVYFDAATPAGTYSLTSATVYDRAGNWTQYSAAQLAALGFETSFTVADRNVAPTAYVTAPAVIVEGHNASAALSLTLLDVAQWSGWVSMSFSPAASTAKNGTDVLVSDYSATFSVSQSSPGNYTIELPSIAILADGAADAVETVAVTVHAGGQIFASGTDTTTVLIRLIDKSEAHNDFNGDGLSDVLWRNDDGTVTDWIAQPDGTFAANHLGIDPGASWHVAGSGDFNGDGRTDVLWRNDDGTVTDWIAQADGSFAGNHLGLNPGTTWHVGGSGDFNGDGRADLFWQNDDGSVTEWLAQADGSFAGNPLHANPGRSWHVAGTGDFNGDNRDDVLWQNESGLVTEWLAQADGTFAGNPLNISTGSTWHVAATGDFNGDGRTDVLWRNDDGSVTDWIAQADGSFAGNHLGVNPGTTWHVAGVGDFNGDGRTDVLWRNDDGSITDWLAQADGSFAGNHLGLNPGASWHVQDPFA